MRTLLAISVIYALATGCGQNILEGEKSRITPQTQASVIPSNSMPNIKEIIKYSADPIPANSHFKNFVIDRLALESIITSWHQVPKNSWEYNYIHVSLEARTGIIEIAGGSIIKWMVKPGGLAKITFSNGQSIYLARGKQQY